MSTEKEEPRGLCDCNQGRLPCTCKPEPLHRDNDGLDEYRQPVHVGELDPAQRLALARGEK